MAKEVHVAFILKKLNSGIVDAKDIISEFCSKFHKTERTFWTKWKLAQSEYQILIEKRNKQIDNITTQQTINDVSNGLKTKSERLMNLQRQADDIQRMLDHNITPDIVKSPKQLEYMEIERKLTYVERATLMKSLRDLQSEISKIEGDYAPTKQDVKLEDTRPSTKIKLNDGTEIEM
jgi:RNA polymerase-interacting CarD/CdnL/TRCF family regulator